MAEHAKNQAPLDHETATNAPESGIAGLDPLIGTVLHDRFRILSLIARGGMGKVYRAEQLRLGRICAVKILKPTFADENDPEFRKRFCLEAATMSKLTHPNTITLFDHGCTPDGVYFMAMEYLAGRTLHRALREERIFRERRALHIAAQICRSLQEAHELGVIHRDLKPANVFLVPHNDELDFVKVLDFGLVKQLDSGAEDLTKTGLFMGSPKYMSPEQVRGESVDGRSDIYSLGIMMFEMVAGRAPFEYPTSVRMMMAHVHDAMPRPSEVAPSISLSHQTEQLIMKCVARDPDDRFDSMRDLVAAIEGIMAELAESEPPQSSRRIRLASAGRMVEDILEPASRQTASLLASHRVKQGRGFTAIFLAGVLTLGVGGIAVMLSRGQLHAELPTSMVLQVPSSAAMSAVHQEHALARAPNDSTTKSSLQVTTTPPGATVFDSNGVRLCSTTPCVVARSPNQIAAGVLGLTVLKDGYVPVTTSVSSGQTETMISLNIKRESQVVRGKPGAPAAHPSRLRDIPY